MAKAVKARKAKSEDLNLSQMMIEASTGDKALNTRAYLVLREALLSGRFAPGMLLNIRPLAEELNMSPMPVREALSRLRSDGALEALANRAFRVPVPTIETYREIMILRLRLEACLCERAAVVATAEDVQEIILLYNKMMQAVDGALEDYLYAHRRFHFGIYRAARMPVVLSVAENTWLRIGPVLRASSLGTRLLQDQHHHSSMLRAVKTADPEALIRALNDDVTDGVDLIHQFLTSINSRHADG